MEFLSSNFGWLILGGVVLVIPTFLLSIWGFMKNVADMPDQMTKIMAEMGDGDEPVDEVEAMANMTTGFFSGALKHFFGPSLLRMLPAMALGAFTSLLFLGGVVGLLVRLLS